MRTDGTCAKEKISLIDFYPPSTMTRSTTACPTATTTSTTTSIQNDAHGLDRNLLSLSCADLCQKARAIWLQQEQPMESGTVVDEDDGDNYNIDNQQFPTVRRRIDVVEALYRHVWNRRTSDTDPELIANHETYDASSLARKKMKRTTCCCSLQKNSLTEKTTTTVVSSEKNEKQDGCQHWKVIAGEKLALMYLQSQRSFQADILLQTLGYPCRLARCVLDYDNAALLPSVHMDNNDKKQKQQHSIPCCIYDHAISPLELEVLLDVFGDPNASYWTEHNYSVEPPSPYFSYILNIRNNHKSNDDREDHDDTHKNKMLYRLIRKLQNLVKPHFPNITDATSVELWAHNRPTCTGHQFHFDSDNEGCTSIIRNPIVTCVLYLNGGDDDDSDVGGPSIVTTQRLASRSLAESGWACPPRKGRMLALDGKVFHGVIPGKISEEKSHDNHQICNGEHSCPAGRRVTVMLAFWRRIRIRDQPGAAACAWPTTSSSTSPSSWANRLLAPIPTHNESNQHHDPIPTGMDQVPVERTPIRLDCIYEPVDPQIVASTNRIMSKPEDPPAAIKPWNRKMGFPEYEQIFQGF